MRSTVTTHSPSSTTDPSAGLTAERPRVAWITAKAATDTAIAATPSSSYTHAVRPPVQIPPSSLRGSPPT
jgi:hypothetical protein